MITIIFMGFLLLASAVALADWRRGWMLALVVGVLQDPARKVTPGTPIAMTFSIVLVYFIILFASHATLQRNMRDMAQRFAKVTSAAGLFFLFLIVAAINGLVTYGMEFWKAPALSLFIYLMPIPALILGHAFADREEVVLSYLRLYAIVTSFALIGTPLEYLNFKWQALGMVAMPEGFIRQLPGVNIRILSGFYRAPDIMGWHAATLMMVGVTLAMKNRKLQSSWPWIFVAAWGFFNCMLSGRRKAVYATAVFAIIFVWRYARRLTTTQFVSFALIGMLLMLVVTRLSQSEESSVYTKGTAVTQAEVLQRLEGGFLDTIHQFGIMGADLGTPTQGVRHLLGHDENVGWQEGGLGKLTVEVGLPGVFAGAVLIFTLLRLLFKIASFGDEPASSQLLRVALLSIFIANVVMFLVSAQAYSDPVLVLVSSFFLGCLLATPSFEERSAVAVPDSGIATAALTRRATA